MGPDDEVGLLMKQPLPSMQRAQDLGRPVMFEDVHRGGLRQTIRQVMRQRGLQLTDQVSATPVLARLDAGRWLTDCPLCNGAELVSEQDPVFVCLSCGSQGMWWPVKFPTSPKRQSIDDEVRKRTDIHGWAWNPGETLTMLRAETQRLAG